TGLILCIQGIAQPRQYKQEEIEFRIQRIQLLDEVKTKMTEEIEISAYANSITSEQIAFLADNLVKHPGNSGFHLHLSDDEEPDWKVSLRSLTKKVEMNDELVHFLNEQRNFNIRIGVNNN